MPDKRQDIEKAVKRAMEGDHQAFRELFDHYGEKILNYIRYFINGDTDSAKDLMQETFLTAYKALSGLRKPGRFQSWLYSIASNLCRDHLRKRKKSPVPGSDFLDSVDAGNAQKFGHDPERRWNENAVRESVRCLPEKYRQVFLLKKMENRKYDEIAGLLGCSVRTVKYRTEKAVVLFEKELKRRGIDLGS